MGLFTTSGFDTEEKLFAATRALQVVILNAATLGDIRYISEVEIEEQSFFVIVPKKSDLIKYFTALKNGPWPKRFGEF